MSGSGGPGGVGKPQDGGAATLTQLTGPAGQRGELLSDLPLGCQDELGVEEAHLHDTEEC